MTPLRISCGLALLLVLRPASALEPGERGSLPADELQAMVDAAVLFEPLIAPYATVIDDEQDFEILPQDQGYRGFALLGPPENEPGEIAMVACKGSVSHGWTCINAERRIRSFIEGHPTVVYYDVQMSEADVVDLLEFLSTKVVDVDRLDQKTLTVDEYQLIHEFSVYGDIIEITSKVPGIRNDMMAFLQIERFPWGYEVTNIAHSTEQERRVMKLRRELIWEYEP